MSSVPVSGAVNVPMAQQQPQLQQVVQQSTTVQPEIKQVVPAPQQVVQAINRRGGNGVVAPQLNVNLPSSMFYLNLGLVVLTALSANECFKYFINKAIQVNDGNPLYFVGYAVLTALLTFAVQQYCCGPSTICGITYLLIQALVLIFLPAGPFSAPTYMLIDLLILLLLHIHLQHHHCRNILIDLSSNLNPL